jgi:hypothetical protein
MSHNSLRTHWSCLPLVAGVSFLLTSCGSDLDLGSVQGKLTKNGQPQRDLWVEFVPVAGGRPAEGRTNSEGHYELRYTSDKPGALVGRHRVRIYSGGELDARDNELSPRKEVFSSEVDVQSGDNELDFSIGETEQ